MTCMWVATLFFFIFLLLLIRYRFETRTFQFTGTARDETASREPAYPCVYRDRPETSPRNHPDGRSKQGTQHHGRAHPPKRARAKVLRCILKKASIPIHLPAFPVQACNTVATLVKRGDLRDILYFQT